MSPGALSLNSKNLSSLPLEVKVPTYDRSKVKAGIVHVGIGGFHRAHQAYYTNLLLEDHGVTDWGICGVALLKYDRKIYDTLVEQNGLYTLMITAPDGTTSATVIGSIVEVLYAPENPEVVIDKMAHPDIKIITLTITEGGYNFDAATGEFQLQNEAIQKDIANPLAPETIFGYLTQSFKRRRERGAQGVTIQSCDNIQQNGEVTKKMLYAYISAAEPELLPWVELNVSFPNAMVDRITPVTTQQDIETVRDTFGIDDKWPVVCEPFTQWVIEDTYSQGRPQWDLVGAQFVSHVHAYEKMKIRLLNGSHTALAFTGILCHYTYVYETMKDPLLVSFLSEFMQFEVTPILDEVIGIDLSVYRATLLERFGNTNIKDQLTRIASETSAKIPKFLIATITDQLSLTRNDVNSVKRATVVLAAWCHYCELSIGVPSTTEVETVFNGLTVASDEGENTPPPPPSVVQLINSYQIQDAMRATLVAHAVASKQDTHEERFLRIPTIFGTLVENEQFVALYVKLLKSIRSDGIVHVLKNLSEF